MHLKHCSCILLVVLCVLTLTLSVSFAQNLPFTGEVNSNDINVRSDSTAGSQVICQVSKGVKLEVISESYGWYKVRLPKSAPSFVKQNLFECVNYETNPIHAASLHTETSKRCLNAKAIKDKINIRVSPSESSPVLGKIAEDEIVKVIRTKGDWFGIEPVKNSYGWINIKFISPVVEPKIDKKQLKQRG